MREDNERPYRADTDMLKGPHLFVSGRVQQGARHCGEDGRGAGQLIRANRNRQCDAAKIGMQAECDAFPRRGGRATAATLR